MLHDYSTPLLLLLLLLLLLGVVAG